MGQVNQFDFERSGADFLAGRQLGQRCAAKLVLIQLRTDHAHREHPSINDPGEADLPQHVGERAHMVLVTVSEDDRLDVFGPVTQVFEVGKNEVDAEHFRSRKHQAGVDHHDLAAVLDDHHVLADFPQSAEGEKLDPIATHAAGTPASASSSSTASRSRSVGSTSGNRMVGGIRPRAESAALTGIGLTTTPIAS